MKGLKNCARIKSTTNQSLKSQTALSLEKHKINRLLFRVVPCASVSNVQNVQYENEFYLLENEPVGETSLHMNIFFNEDSF